MISIERCSASDPRFVQLVQALDLELADRDGDAHEFYHQFNGIEDIRHAVIVTHEGEAVACGAFKQFDQSSVEIKRMYTLPEFRGKGLGRKILKELEEWAKEIGNSNCVLETGLRQQEAIALYNASGYVSIPNYGQYKGISNSRCFSKSLT